jgi:tRNA A37 threonylcarbamoyladenosine synthetase subunit TsaC/SUA5/YrdC
MSGKFKDFVFLTQTDTTIGFVSQNEAKLSKIKNRSSYKFYIKAVNSLKTLQTFTRVPSSFKNRVRRSSKTTFIMPNGSSYRVVQNEHHLLLLNRLKWAYTTSANLSNEPYNEEFALKNADVIISPLNKNAKASTIVKIGNKNIKRIR